ncbi:MAG: hypothetical protein ACW986_08720 [Promethearchaeota archaeon]|jgi:hypothetical protein
MSKKKKKEKRRKVEDNPDELGDFQGYSLDNALHSTKSTETTLQSLMREVTEEKGYVRQKKETEIIQPQLTHESRSKIAEAYALEDVPLTQRTPDQKTQRKRVAPQDKQSVVAKTPKSKEASRPRIQVEASTVSAHREEGKIEREEDLPPTPPTKQPSPIKKGNIYQKLSDFFEELLVGYNSRYERWENSISNILSILRKMRKITKKNTDDLVVSINNLYNKIQVGLELFKLKRGEVEKVTEVDVESMSGEFKRVLGMLELQIKEYQLKRETDDLIHEMKSLS